MELPIGSIILWKYASIPSGWQVCDGTNGTPNCIDRFIWGCSSDALLKGTGGQSSHSHTVTGDVTGTSDAHGHTGISGTSGTPSANDKHVSGSIGISLPNHTHSISVTVVNEAGHSHPHPGLNDASNLPVHVKLIFIMKIS
jgi:microcystin-dependent protein